MAFRLKIRRFAFRLKHRRCAGRAAYGLDGKAKKPTILYCFAFDVAFPKRRSRLKAVKGATT